MTRDIREWEQGNGKSLSETHMLFVVVKDPLHSPASAVEWGWVSGTSRPLAGIDICFLCCCLWSASMAPCLFQVQSEKKRGNIDIHTRGCFQDVIAAVNLFESFNYTVISEVFGSRTWYEWSDYCVSKADNNGTVTKRVQKVSNYGSWQELRKVTLAAEKLLNLYWSKMHRTELFSAAITVPMRGLALKHT